MILNCRACLSAWYTCTPLCQSCCWAASNVCVVWKVSHTWIAATNFRYDVTDFQRLCQMSSLKPSLGQDVACLRRISETSLGCVDTSHIHEPNSPCSLTARIHSARNSLLVWFSGVSWPLTSRTRSLPLFRRIRKSGLYLRTTPLKVYSTSKPR